jgi:protein-disulfide isomerase
MLTLIRSAPARGLLLSSAVLLMLAGCGEAKAPEAADAAADATPAATAAAPVAAATPASAGSAKTSDWTTMVVQTPEGGFRMGNPDAKVKIVEYAALTCSHCQRFHLEGASALKAGLVKAGQVSYEVRPFMLNAIDIAATLVATCQGPQQFFSWADQFYRNHDAFIQPFTLLNDADVKQLSALPQDAQVRRLAELGGLDAFVRTRGMPKTQFEKCVSNSAEMSNIMERQRLAMERDNVTATPTLILNGQKLEGVTTWDALRPKLEAALG